MDKKRYHDEMEVKRTIHDMISIVIEPATGYMTYPQFQTEWRQKWNNKPKNKRYKNWSNNCSRSWKKDPRNAASTTSSNDNQQKNKEDDDDDEPQITAEFSGKKRPRKKTSIKLKAMTPPKAVVVDDGLHWSRAHDRLITTYKKSYDNGDEGKMKQVMRLLNRTKAQCSARMNVLFSSDE